MRPTILLALTILALVGCKEPERVVVECKEQCNNKEIGRYAIVSSQNTVGMYRLDTVTGELNFCRMVGMNPNYQLICTPETR
jgi:hypothetical protein